MTEDAVAMWESLADKPLIKCCPRADTFPMFMPTTVDVVNGKKFKVAIATAGTTHRPMAIMPKHSAA